MTDFRSLAELETSMRPARNPRGVFLGRTESLEAVIAQDRQMLRTLGISHEQIASALESALQSTDAQVAHLKREGRTAELSERESALFPRIRPGRLPSTDVGFLVGGDLQVFTISYRGLQGCPWGCGGTDWCWLDFLVLNRQSSKYVTGPGLIVHMIREHRFFGGLEGRNRVDPVQAIEVFELPPSVSIG